MNDPGDGPTIAGGSGEQCPSCGATLAPGQRYCLECGNRRGDPRLPFMDAVVFMDAVSKGSQEEAPKPAASQREKRPLLSANASLVAGIGTLVLAIGVGVLIGRSGDNGSATAANATPQIIKVGGSEGSGGGEATEEASAGASKKKGKAKAGKSKKAEEKSKTGSSGQTKATEEVLEPKVPQAKPEASLGEKCEKGTAGCSANGKFEGEFFGE